jgi:hypothetical protein
MVRAAPRLTLVLGFGLVSLVGVACSRSSPPAPTSSEPSASPSASASPSVVSVVDAAVAAPPSSPSPSQAILREEKQVVVDGVTETWRLEWIRPPLPACMDSTWETCACAGFSFGEKGDLDLVRVRPGAHDERLHLSPLFDDGDARLPRWVVTPEDRSSAAKKPSVADIQKRELVPVMKLADYDHDGRATEFVLQVAAYACGHTPSILVGITKTRGLHAFPAGDKPNEPLTLDSVADWEKVKTKLPLTLAAIKCGDHGATEETSIQVVKTDAGLRSTEAKRPCP